MDDIGTNRLAARGRARGRPVRRQRDISHFVNVVTSSKRAIAITAAITLIIIGPVKFVLVRSLLSMGVPREILQAQDAVVSAALSAALVWVLLMAVWVRRKQVEEGVEEVASLNHEVRNALQVIFASDYLRQSDRAAAILESVERTDAALRVLLPQARKLRMARDRSTPTA